MFGVLKDPFSVLSQKQRSRAIRSVIYTLLQACLDVFSLAAVIPVFHALFTPPSEYPIFIFTANFNQHWKEILAIIIVLFAIKNILGLILARRQSNFISEVAVSLTEKLYRQFFQQRWTSYLQDNTAEVVRKIKTTPSDYAQYIVQGYILLVSDLVSCLLMAGLIVIYNPIVALIVLMLSIPVTLFYLFFRRNTIAKIDHAFRVSTPEASIVLGQGIDSFAEAKIYGKENFFVERFMKLRELTSRQLADLRTATQVPSRLFELTSIVCFCSIIVYGKLRTDANVNIVILLGVLSVAMYRIIPSLNRMMTTLSQMEAYAYSIAEITKGFEESASIPQRDPVPFNNSLELRNLSFHYEGGKDIFNKLNFTIQKGEFVMIEGQSGVGKSTLLHILAGLLPNYAGEIFVDGKPVLAQALQSTIAFVPQAPILIQDTLAKNIAFADEILNEAKLNGVCRIAALSDFVDELPEKYLTSIGERGTNVSGGQRQRINLARALYREADILILDEATNQLDHQTKELVLTSLLQLCKEGKTIILSSHDHLIKPFAHKILKLG
jgi:ABC-type multidrug transport system fused ATPase/permease subunit